jgi:GABA(A) receptor-associated protein
MNNFQKKHSFEKRRDESLSVINKYPDRLPIIVQKDHKSELPGVDKCKYLVPRNMTMSQFSFVIRKRIKLEPSQAIFITINHTLVASSKLLSDVYEEQKDEDGFLYVIYTGENTFG